MQRHDASPSLGAAFGDHIRKLREQRAEKDPAYSLRQVAFRCGVTPAYLSRVERGEVAPPGEETLVKLAHELGEDPDVLLAMAGKISSRSALCHSRSTSAFRGADPIHQINPRRCRTAHRPGGS